MSRWSDVKALAPCALPVAGVLAIITCFFWYSHLLRGASAAYVDPTTLGARVHVHGSDPSMLPAAEFRARLFWGAGSAALVLALVWNVVLASYVVETVLHGERRHNAHRWVWGLTITVATTASLILYDMPTSGDVGRLLLLAVEARTGVLVWHYTTFTNIFTAIGVTFILAAASTLLLPVSGQGDVRLGRLRRRIQLSKLGLYSASGLLAVGVFQLWALYTWPASFLPAVAANPVRMMGSSVTFAASVLFTGCLVFIFLPTAIVHQTWVGELMHEASIQEEDFEPTEWLRKKGLDTPALTMFNRVAGILAPIATAGMTHLIG